jgi:DNA primase
LTDFERIKDKLDLLSVITQETGLSMRGKHLEQCPLCGGHECFSIFDNNKKFKCHQCPASGDVFSFLEQYKHIDNIEALKYAARIAGITLTEKARREVKLSTKERIFIEAANYYHGHMLDNGGKKYLIEGRGHKEDVLRKMRVGWTDGWLVEYLRSKNFTDQEIKASGLAKVRMDGEAHHLVDFFVKGVAIFPHMEKERVLHFTIKDPAKKYKYQLPEKERIKDWRFYNQEALSKFGEIIVVEGENDLLSVMDADVLHVIGIIGSPAEYQIKALQTYCAKKHLYLWMDNDEDPKDVKAKGKGYIRRICEALSNHINVRVMTYPEEYKDPDEFINSFLPGIDRRKEIRRLQDDAVDYVTWEISEIAKLDTLDKRLKALKDRKVFAAVADMVEAEKLVFIEKLTKLGFSEKAIEQQLETNHDLRQKLAEYFERVPKKDADPNYIASEIFKGLSETGRWYRDRMGDVYLLYQHQTYSIGNNRPFNALMKRLTRLLPTKEPGRSVWESLASEAYNSGIQIDLASWIHTDRGTDTIYINLNSPGAQILKVKAQGIEEIPNGMNDEAVLLKSSRKILPMNYLPDTDIREGMKALKELVFDNMTCEREQRYLILCWFFSAFLLDFSPYMGLMKFSGASESGKTTAARLLSVLLYGEGNLGDPTAASAYAVASQNPLLIIDNLESDDFTKSILKFLLLSATKGSKEKRTQGTDSDTIQETPKALVLITAIEPFTKAELINRTFDIDFSFKFKNDGFVEDEVIRAIVKKRDIILSSLLKFIQREVLPNLEARKDYITVLKKEHKNHAKNRTDEYLALLMLMLEKMLKYVPYYEENDFLFGTPEEIPTAAKEVRNAWIAYQNAKAKDTETSSNNIIKLLDGLVSEYISKMKGMKEPESHKDYPDDEVFIYTHQDYHIEVIKTKAKSYCMTCHKVRDSFADGEKCECTDAQAGDIYSRAIFEFTATSSEMVDALDLLCRNRGIKNPYSTAAIFTKRLSNDEKTLKSAGWDLVTKPGLEPYYKKVQGMRFLKFRKVIVR